MISVHDEHIAQMDRARTEVFETYYQYRCVCRNVWWRRVKRHCTIVSDEPQHATCKRCHLVQDPIPQSETFGAGMFICDECGYSFIELTIPCRRGITRMACRRPRACNRGRLCGGMPVAFCVGSVRRAIAFSEYMYCLRQANKSLEHTSAPRYMFCDEQLVESMYTEPDVWWQSDRNKQHARQS